MRRRTVTAIEALPEAVGTYRDAEGFVYVDVPVGEAAEMGWIALTAEQRQHVRPLCDIDRAKLKKADRDRDHPASLIARTRTKLGEPK